MEKVKLADTELPNQMDANQTYTRISGYKSLSNFEANAIAFIFKKSRKDDPRMTSLPHLCVGEDHRTDPPGSYAKTHAR